MKIELITNAVWSLLMLALSHHLATGALEFVHATLLTMYQAGLAAGLAIAGIVLPSKRVQYRLLVASNVAMGLLIVPQIFGFAHWPPGDDGGGMSWGFIMGGASLLSAAVALLTAHTGRLSFARSDDKPANAPDAGDS